jgi:hypothetical protein
LDIPGQFLKEKKYSMSLCFLASLTSKGHADADAAAHAGPGAGSAQPDKA